MNGPALDERASVPDAVATVDGVDVDYDAVERIGPIGSGSNATVYEARLDDRRIALKEPSFDDDAVDDRFVGEAEAWSRVADHDHVVGVVDWGSGEGAEGTDGPWLALELMDGGDLRERGRLDLGEALWIARCLTDAVAHAHDAGVVHLDLTPDNVLFRSVEDGWDVPKVGDWGLARLLDDAAESDGFTPPYAAPEQFERGRSKTLDERTDVYQLGAVLYRLLTGEAPYSGAPSAVEAAVLDDDSPRPTAVDPSLPDRVDAVVGRAMATDPDDRYETAGALRDDVDDLLTAVTGDGSGGADGSTTGAALETQGFERVTEGYFEGREPASPSAAWRAGLDLVDVHEGYAVERDVERDGERVSLVGHLRERLDEGETVAVVGPPGAGKSTVCKQVACEWFESGRGPVLYRESGQGQRLDAPATLQRYLRGVDGHALVVVEDAVRGEASAIFDAVDAVEDDPDVRVLLDARREEWEDAEFALDRERERVRQRAVDTEFLSPPDREAYERFVAAVERSTGTDIDVGVDTLLPDVRNERAGDERQPGELFLLLHRLLSHVNAPETDDETVTTLEEAVRLIRLDLERQGETFLDVGVAANLLNAAGIGVYPELLHAVAPDEETAVAEAVDALDGRVLFTDDGDRTGPYRAVHEVWSAEFLANVLDAEGAADAHERVGRVLSRILSLADDAELREDVAWIFHGETACLERLADAPGEWADAVVEAVFEFGTEWPKLAPLFGTTDASVIDLPDVCSAELLPRRALWRGDMYREAHEYDIAQAEYDRVGDVLERLEHTSVDADLLRGRSEVGIGNACYDRAEYERARERFREALAIAQENGFRSLEATVLDELGSVAYREGAMDRARELFQQSLDLTRELGDRKGEADAHTGLGSVALFQQRYEQSHEHHENALEIYRELDDRGGKIEVLFNLGSVAYERAHRDRGEYDRAITYCERSLEIAREIGDRRSAARSLYTLGQVADSKGESDRAREYLEQSLDITDEIGDRNSKINSLIALGNVAESQGTFHEARAQYEAAFELAEEIGNPRSRAHSATGIGLVCTTVAEYDVAREYLSQGLDDARAIDDTRIEGFMLHYLGDVARLRGEFGRAHDHYRDALEIRREMGARRREAFSRTALGRIARKQARYDRACEHFETVRDIASDMDATDLECQGLCGLGATARRRGDLGRARERLERALSRSEELDEPVLLGRIRVELGRLDLETDDPSAARDHAERSHATVDDIGAIHWRARSRELQGRIAAETDDPETAREHWQAALTVFEDVGAWEDSLATLEALVELCRETGDEGAAREWCERARETLAAAPEEVADRHREWVERHTAALSGD